jgi:hypothetical protein
MEMPMPDNTLPMMTGFGQFRPIEMGGIFTVMKIREGLAANEYKDPGPTSIPREQLHTSSTAMSPTHCDKRARPSRQPRARPRGLSRLAPRAATKATIE